MFCLYGKVPDFLSLMYARTSVNVYLKAENNFIYCTPTPQINVKYYAGHS